MQPLCRPVMAYEAGVRAAAGTAIRTTATSRASARVRSRLCLLPRDDQAWPLGPLERAPPATSYALILPLRTAPPRRRRCPGAPTGLAGATTAVQAVRQAKEVRDVRVRCHAFHGQTITPLAGVSDALKRLEQDGFVWLDYTDPSPQDLSALIEPLGIHPLSVEDCLDQDQVPKIEDFPSYAFVLFNSYSYADGALAVDEVDFFSAASS